MTWSFTKAMTKAGTATKMVRFLRGGFGFNLPFSFSSPVGSHPPAIQIHLENMNIFVVEIRW